MDVLLQVSRGMRQAPPCSVRASCWAVLCSVLPCKRGGSLTGVRVNPERVTVVTRVQWRTPTHTLDQVRVDSINHLVSVSEWTMLCVRGDRWWLL